MFRPRTPILSLVFSSLVAMAAAMALVGRRALRRGRYRVVVTAVDSVGNRSTARTRAFRIVG